MFSKKTFKFLKDLDKNNNRDWFAANKHRYEEDVRAPALEFVESMAPALHRVSPYFDASPKKVGGSLMRIYRDTRFGADKTPYKTNIGIHFRHVRAKDVHAPGFYLHIEPKEAFFGAGIWRPESSTLKGIRTLIDEHPKEWTNIKKKVCNKNDFALQGDRLKRAPKGFDPEHALIDDLKRKDFIAVSPLPLEQVVAKDLPKQIAKLMRGASPLMKFLCTADDLMY